MRKVLIVLILAFFQLKAGATSFDYKYYNHWKTAYHKHNESSYQHAYCSACKGIEEYKLPDYTRVDCLTDTHAIEFDFANKWAESIGQALHYALMTGKKAKVVLILDEKYKQKQMIYFERVKRIGEKHNIDVEFITDDILKLNKEGKCPYKDCKCNRKSNR